MRYQLHKLNLYLRGRINCFGIANAYQYCVSLDHWLRCRVRMCYWRQWQKQRAKVANSLKRGGRIQSVVGCGITSKVPWRSSKTLGINQVIISFLFGFMATVLFINDSAITRFGASMSKNNILIFTICSRIFITDNV